MHYIWLLFITTKKESHSKLLSISLVMNNIINDKDNIV